MSSTLANSSTMFRIVGDVARATCVSIIVFSADVAPARDSLQPQRYAQEPVPRSYNVYTLPNPLAICLSVLGRQRSTPKRCTSAGSFTLSLATRKIALDETKTSVPLALRQRLPRSSRSTCSRPSCLVRLEAPEPACHRPVA